MSCPLHKFIMLHVLSVIPRPSPAPVMATLEAVRAWDGIINHNSVAKAMACMLQVH